MQLGIRNSHISIISLVVSSSVPERDLDSLCIQMALKISFKNLTITHHSYTRYKFKTMQQSCSRFNQNFSATYQVTNVVAIVHVLTVLFLSTRIKSMAMYI